ncbi:hypothetical protein MMPV_007978 [Pyropia vietnamensis]
MLYPPPAAIAARLAAFLHAGRASKAYCIGLNYAAHVSEMKNMMMGSTEAPGRGAPPPSRLPPRPTAATPTLFLKPASSYHWHGIDGPLRVPSNVEWHHEVEVGAILTPTSMVGDIEAPSPPPGGVGRAPSRPAPLAGAHIRKADALSHVLGYTLCLDMTARDIQAAAKAGGKPWTAAKCGDGFLPLASETVPASDVEMDASGRPALEVVCIVNGVERQRGGGQDWLWDLPSLVSYASSVCAVEENDLLLTGTPAGVGALVAGDRIEAVLRVTAGAGKGREVRMAFDCVAGEPVGVIRD